VTLAIVDTGVNLAYLQARAQPKLNAGKSWRPAGVTTKPGSTQWATGRCAPTTPASRRRQATLIDYAVLPLPAVDHAAHGRLLSRMP